MPQNCGVSKKYKTFLILVTYIFWKHGKATLNQRLFLSSHCELEGHF